MEKTTPQKNKELLIEGFDTLFNKRDFAAAEKLWSQNYIHPRTSRRRSYRRREAR